MGFPSGSLGTSHSWASGPPKTMKLVAQAFQPVPGHPRAGVLHFQSRNQITQYICPYSYRLIDPKKDEPDNLAQQGDS